MKYLTWLGLLALAVVAANCGGPRVPHGDIPALTAEPGVEPADNSFCYVCHLNYKTEKIVVGHKPAGIGCAKCHGWSDDHSSDEDGITPPETMYPTAAVNIACLKCHRAKDADDVAAEQPILTPEVGDKVCTDCHGSHRLAVRTRRWDKTTGKLIYDDGVRMIRGMGSE